MRPKADLNHSEKLATDIYAYILSLTKISPQQITVGNGEQGQALHLTLNKASLKRLRKSPTTPRHGHPVAH
jgi:hypothetical protein